MDRGGKISLRLECPDYAPRVPLRRRSSQPRRKLVQGQMDRDFPRQPRVVAGNRV